VTTADLFVALAPVLEILSRLGVRHYVGGSIASSAHGVPRASIDADVVAELGHAHATPFVAALRQGYYVSEERVRDAIARRASFNVIHLETMVKVVVFVAKDRPFDRRALERARPTAAEGVGELPVSSAEDTLLAKLEWYRRGGETSERQWSDVTGLLRVRSLDQPYLRQGALELGVADLLDRALEEAEQHRRGS
jgi:hypothetical protein